MKGANFFLRIFVIAGLVTVSFGHDSHERPERDCSVKFIRYRLDREPAEYGLSAGFYAPKKRAYVGLGVYNRQVLAGGRIQLDPPGFYKANVVGSGFLDKGPDIWYLSPRRHQEFKWVKSSRGQRVPFAVDITFECCAISTYIGRVRDGNKTFLGNVVDITGTIYYVDDLGISRQAKNYEVLTCQTSRYEKKIPMPKFAVATPSASSCIHNWVPYNYDKEPETKGIWAGTHTCGNEVYVGKGKPLAVFFPGRIHTTGDVGFFAFRDDREVKIEGEIFYLADNLNYTYKWVDYEGVDPPNAVTVGFSESSSSSLPIGRVNVDGRVRVGPVVEPIVIMVSDNGTSLQYRYNLEVLVCDPWPKYQCGQQWKKYDPESGDSPTVDGFPIGKFYIGRSVTKCINDCDFGIGIFNTRRGGVSYLDELRAEGAFDDSSSAEYLVKDPSYSYKWKASRNGERVPNALELQREGHVPFYIGRTRISDDIFVGKVRPGEGLFFVDLNGKLKVTSSYEVLTCGSSDEQRGLYDERSEASWFGPYGCPVRKEWSFKKWRCVCRDEFKGLLTKEGAVWSEDTCSYL